MCDFIARFLVGQTYQLRRRLERCWKALQSRSRLPIWQHRGRRKCSILILSRMCVYLCAIMCFFLFRSHYVSIYWSTLVRPYVNTHIKVRAPHGGLKYINRRHGNNFMAIMIENQRKIHRYFYQRKYNFWLSISF